MKKIFTLLTALFAVMAVNAQTWDITAWETADVTTTTTIDGLTYYGEAKSAYAAGKKTFEDSKEWAGRIKMGGSSTFKADAMSRAFSFEGKKGCTVKVYAVHGSSSGDDRNVFVSQNPTDTKNDVANTFGKVATVAGAEAPKVLTATIPADGTVYVWADNNVGVYAIVMEEAGGGDDPTPGGETDEFVSEIYEAVKNVDGAWVASNEFANAVIADGKSEVQFGTENMEVTAVAGTTAKDVYQEAGTDFAGWTEWNEVKWDIKNQGDIAFGYILGTGNPAVSFTAEEVLDEDNRTGHYRPAYEYYEADGSKGMPVMGLYYKFAPKANGKLSVAVWSNKGNRNTFFVEESTKQPVAYTVEGYINAQNYPEGHEKAGQKKWLTNEEIQALHDASGNASNPYIIGAGNQPFWGNVTVNVEAGKSYWLFQHSSQIGFQGYEFTPEGTTGISDIVVEKAQNDAIYNIAGQRVSGSAKGLVIKNGKKYFVK